jgi:hypothetical protein
MKIPVPLLFATANADNTRPTNYFKAKPMMCFKDGEQSEWRHLEWLGWCREQKAKGK